MSIRIEPLFFLMAIALGWLNSQTLMGTALWAIIILISVLFHECGHALTAVLFGQRAQMTLTVFGGVTQHFGPQLTGVKNFLVVLNGPIAGFALYFMCVFLLKIPAITEQPVLFYLATIGSYVNLFWTCVNLLPVHPLDGGQLMLILFRGIFGLRGTRMAFVFSLIISVLVAIAFFLLNAFIAGSIFLMFAFESYRQLQFYRNMTHEDEKGDLKQSLASAITSYQSGDLSRAEQQLLEVIEKSKKGLVYLKAISYLAEIYEQHQEFQKAYALLDPEKAKLAIASLKQLQRLAFSLQYLDEAMKLGIQIYQEEADGNVALLNARLHAKLLQTKQAVGWFETALRDGLSNPEYYLNQSDFDPIRHTVPFEELLAKLKT